MALYTLQGCRACGFWPLGGFASCRRIRQACSLCLLRTRIIFTPGFPCPIALGPSKWYGVNRLELGLGWGSSKSGM